MENIEQQNNTDKISPSQIDNLFKQLDKQNPEFSQFAKKFQDNLKTKNFPDQNSELVASISVLSKITDKSQLQLAEQIMLKTKIKPSLFASETKDEIQFLPLYIKKLQANNIVGKKLDLMETPEGANKMEGKLKSLFNVWVGGKKKISTKGMDKTQKKAFSQQQINTFNTQTSVSAGNFDAKDSFGDIMKKYGTEEQKKEYKNKETQDFDKLDNLELENNKKLYLETKENQTILKQKYSDKIPEKLNEEQKTEALKSVGLTEKELEDKIETHSQRNQTGMTVSEVISFLYTKSVLGNSETAQKDPDYISFQKNFAPIQEDLNIHEQDKEMTFGAGQPPIAAENLQNLTTAQSAQIIENTDGMSEYHNFGTVETVENYDDPNLALENDDVLENNIYNKAFSNLSEDASDSLAAISKSINPEHIQREKTQKKAFLDKFDGDATKLQTEINKLKAHEKTIFTAEDIANLQKLSKLSKLEHRDNHSPETLKHGKIKIAKLASNTARTTAVGQFMKTVAGNLTARVGDTNLGAEVKVKTDTENKQLKSEIEKNKNELTNYLDELTKIKNTPTQRFIRAKKLISDKNLLAAKSEYQGIVDNYKGTNDANIASKEIIKIDQTIKKERIAEERKKALGYKILKQTSNVKFGDLSLRFDKIWTGKRWSFDNYGSQYFLRDAQRGNKHVLAKVSITLNNNNPSLPPIIVYQMNNGKLELLGTLGYEFRRWKDYGSYLGNYADYGNDFAHSKTIPFSLGLELSDDKLNKPIFVVLKKTGCFDRQEKQRGNPEVEYNKGSCNAKRILKVDDFDNDYVLLKIFNYSRL